MTNVALGGRLHASDTRSNLARRLAVVIKPFLLVAACLLLWETVVRMFDVPAYLAPAPSSIFAQLFSDYDLYLYHGFVTTRETLEGFLLAVVLGVALAVLIVHSRPLEEALYPVLIFIQLTPKMAIAPLLVVWLGFGEAPKTSIAFLIAFFPIVITTVAGLRAASPDLIEMLEGLRASKRQILFKARFPSALPFIFSAMRVSITLSVTGAVVAEFVGANEGLGYLIVASSTGMETNITFAAIFCLAIIGGVLFSLIRLAEQRVAVWHGNIEVAA